MTLTNRTRQQLRERQHQIESRVEHLEALAERDWGSPESPLWASEHTRLLAEWDAIKREFERRGIPQTPDFPRED